VLWRSPILNNLNRLPPWIVSSISTSTHPSNLDIPNPFRLNRVMLPRPSTTTTPSLVPLTSLRACQHRGDTSLVECAQLSNLIAFVRPVSRPLKQHAQPSTRCCHNHLSVVHPGFARSLPGRTTEAVHRHQHAPLLPCYRNRIPASPARNAFPSSSTPLFPGCWE
jgi:hypothetical protein